MTLSTLQQTVADACALRFRQRFQPAGGPGDKVFPPTYEAARYAEEKRFIEGEELSCIHLDSVQSQANRMELALLEATLSGRIELPIVRVDFAAKRPELSPIGVITSLDAPHRLADAILRDSEKDGVVFRKTPEGQVLDTASIQDASGLFGICPTALLFGMWDSTGPRGGLGVKFQRSIVSEIVAVNTVKGVKTSSRIDPLGIVVNAGVAYQNPTTGSWTLETKDAAGKSLTKVGKDGKPSEINHGNVTPTISDANGGVTCAYALQTTVLSLPSLRRLRFPVEAKASAAADLAGRTVLAALGLCAASLALASGCDLRSRCLLVPESPGNWEIIGADGSTEAFSLDADAACSLLHEAVATAKACGLPWRSEGLTLLPSEGLVRLVTRSRELASQA